MKWGNYPAEVSVYKLTRFGIIDYYFQPPEISYDNDLSVFIDGRHRTMWMLEEQLMDKIPMKFISDQNAAEAIFDGFIQPRDVIFPEEIIIGMGQFEDVKFRPDY